MTKTQSPDDVCKDCCCDSDDFIAKDARGGKIKLMFKGNAKTKGDCTHGGCPDWGCLCKSSWRGKASKKVTDKRHREALSKKKVTQPQFQVAISMQMWTQSSTTALHVAEDAIRTNQVLPCSTKATPRAIMLSFTASLVDVGTLESGGCEK